MQICCGFHSSKWKRNFQCATKRVQLIHSSHTQRGRVAGNTMVHWKCKKSKTLTNKLRNHSNSRRRKPSKTKTYDCYLPLAIEINKIVCYPLRPHLHISFVRTIAKCSQHLHDFRHTIPHAHTHTHTSNLFHFLISPKAMIQAVAVRNPIY